MARIRYFKAWCPDVFFIFFSILFDDFKNGIETKPVKIELVSEPLENSEVKEEEDFDDIIEENDDDYAEDPDFDEDKPIKPKKRTQINTDSILSIKVSEKTEN